MSQFQILGRRPFPFKAITIRFADTNFPDAIRSASTTLFRRHRHVVETLCGGRTCASVYALDRGRPHVRVHPEHGAAPRLDGMLRRGRPLPCLRHGICADGFQTTPLRRIAQPTWPKRPATRGVFLYAGRPRQSAAWVILSQIAREATTVNSSPKTYT